MTTSDNIPMTDTPKPMTAERLAEIEARVKEATPGPWQRSGVRKKLTADSIQVCTLDGAGWVFVPMGTDHAGARRDAEFIAYSRQDVPDLIAEVERCGDEIASLRAEVDNLIDPRYQTALEASVSLWKARAEVVEADLAAMMAERDRLKNEMAQNEQAEAERREYQIALENDRDALREALDNIEGGHVPGLSSLVLANNWHSAFTALQQISRAALAKQEPTDE